MLPQQPSVLHQWPHLQVGCPLPTVQKSGLMTCSKVDSISLQGADRVMIAYVCKETAFVNV